MGRRIVIDPGHGGIIDGKYVTPGKRFVYTEGPMAGKAVYEGERNRVACTFLADLLYLAGVEVHSAPDQAPWDQHGRFTDEDVPLWKRVKYANSLKPAHDTLFFSWHSNAISNTSAGAGQMRARGFSIWTSPGQTKSDPIADEIWLALQAADLPMPMRKQSVKDGDYDYEAKFKVLMDTDGPSNLFECGFHDHPDDAKLLHNIGFMFKVAEAIAEPLRQWALR